MKLLPTWNCVTWTITVMNHTTCYKLNLTVQCTEIRKLQGLTNSKKYHKLLGYTTGRVHA